MISARRSNTSNGFTLIEILVAVSIFAIISTASFRLISSQTSANERTNQFTERLYDYQRMVRKIDSDLRQVVKRSSKDKKGRELAALSGDTNTLTFTKNGWSNFSASPRSELQRVQYSLIKDGGSYVFNRVYHRYLDGADEKDSISQPLITGVSELNFIYYDSDDEPQKYWPVRNSDKKSLALLPKRIIVEITTHNEGKLTRAFTLPQYIKPDRSQGLAP